MKKQQKTKKRLVVALGGNALGISVQEQLLLASRAAHTIADLAEQGYEIIVGHGNGPQIGLISDAFEKSGTFMPFPECGAMSQGYIGYHLAQTLNAEFKKRAIERPVACIITQAAVDENGEAFKNPTKPIGIFYTKEQAQKIALSTGFTFAEDAGRGYRRVVPSPPPQKIIEAKTIQNLASSGTVVIACGGGGIPVCETPGGSLRGVSAVIDKDRTCALLALEVHADMLIILTAVEKAYLNFNTDKQSALDTLSAAQAKKYIAEGHFASGSMLPKIEACIHFVEGVRSGSPCGDWRALPCALITSLEKAKEALAGKTGTLITA